jgi:hypothetical protein
VAEYTVNENESIKATFTPEELNSIRHAVNLGILAMNLKGGEVRKLVQLRNEMREALKDVKPKTIQ